MAKKITQANRPIKVTTPLADDVLLLEKFSGRESISELFRYKLDMLADSAETIAFDKLLGQSVTITLTLPDKSVRYINGIVSFLNESGLDSDGEAKFNHFRAEVVPKLWTLTRTTRCQIFQQLSVLDILKKVLAGLTSITPSSREPTTPATTASSTARPTSTSPAGSWRRKGIFYFFTHANGGHTMVVADTPQSPLRCPGPEHVIYDASRRAAPTEDRVTSWEKTQEVRSGQVSPSGTTASSCPTRTSRPSKTIHDTCPGRHRHPQAQGRRQRPASSSTTTPAATPSGSTASHPGGGDQAVGTPEDLRGQRPHDRASGCSRRPSPGLIIDGRGQLPAARRRPQVHARPATSTPTAPTC